LDVVVAVGTERGDKEGGVVVKGVVSGDSKEEVALNIFILGTPDLFTTFVDDCVLMRVVSDGSGAGWGSEEVGEELSFRGDREWEVGEDRGRQGGGGDDGDGGFNDGRWEILDRDISKWDSLDGFFILIVDICILVLGGWGVLELRAYNVSLFRGDGGKDMEEVGWGGGNRGRGMGAIGVGACSGVITTWA
jgi:hypothetical protein